VTPIFNDQIQKTYRKTSIRLSDKNIDYSELINLLLYLGFVERIKGSHHIFYKEGVEEILNLQAKGNKAKPYQVKQVRNLIIKYKLGK
jgi:hypothetical protein